MIKRFFDFSIALLALFLLLPVLILVSCMILILIGRPILFVQKRPGRHGKTFNMFKFRTMTNTLDASGRLLADSERMTRFGQFLRSTSLDELPELLNVLKGDMSLVGPRPLLIDYLPLYSERQSRRHEVRPGISGWAQVNGRNALSWEEKFELDVWYVENRTLWLDLKILILTVWRVIKRDGISQDGEVTMSKFTGNNK